LERDKGLITLYGSRLHYEAFASAIRTYCNFLNDLGADDSIASYHLAGTITGMAGLGFGSAQIAPEIILCHGLILFT
jgi:hypothetical protein